MLFVPLGFLCVVDSDEPGKAYLIDSRTVSNKEAFVCSQWRKN